MKKFKTLLLVAALPVIMGSCVIGSKHYTTGNPIGTKEGFVKSKNFANFDVGIGAAAKEGKITKIGSVDIKIYSNGKISTRVTGE
ncbi:MAG: TRL-like protein family [Bacteroidetes bacterium]|jgi:hypothetical protein|nr:TRL-like protein family [Bacteroidota bacterium]